MNDQFPWGGERFDCIDQKLDVIVSRTAVMHSVFERSQSVGQFLEALFNTFGGFFLEIFKSIFEILESTVGIFQASEDFWGFLLKETFEDTFEDEFGSLEVFDLWGEWDNTVVWHFRN